MRGPFLLFSLLLAGCASIPGPPPARFAQDLPADGKRYTELAPVRVENPIRFPYDEENCRAQLRRLASQVGAELVVLDSEERKSCFLNKDDRCLEMTGRTFVRGEP